ncbi:S-transferase class-mu 28 kDa isozyme [Seminavis robusta]|uniref:S-transferase class-mu 28 kDa isozyme n=1 Tax=Seminavis robusta TaxID=568900 RepID=A0A9N8EVQ6_9STRA|nr:S-transferase class-mu 28 kDa isozyme [Seminavis robusta]|eukprot:Sro1751_g295250.1 S-transferase class-mu 28 kDa isozyme (231) ;mRNA; f:1219-1911
MPKIKLTYFGIEAAAEPIRLALVLSGQEFEDERIAFPDWKELKPKTPYGSLPLMTIDDGPVKTQSMAMLRWVGATCSDTLYPRDKLYDVEEALGVVDDMKKSFEPAMYINMMPQSFGYPEGFGKTDEGKEKIKKLRTEWVEKELPKFLGRLEGLLDKSGGKWLVAGLDNPTIADCHAVVFLRSLTRGHVDYVNTQCLEVNPKVVSYVKRFCNLAPIKERYQDGIGSPAYK